MIQTPWNRLLKWKNGWKPLLWFTSCHSSVQLFFTTSKNVSKRYHGQRTHTMLVTITAKQSYFNLMSRCFWIPLFMRPSLLYFHAFPLFLTQLNNETNENNEWVEPWDTTCGMSWCIEIFISIRLKHYLCFSTTIIKHEG